MNPTSEATQAPPAPSPVVSGQGSEGRSRFAGILSKIGVETAKAPVEATSAIPQSVPEPVSQFVQAPVEANSLLPQSAPPVAEVFTPEPLPETPLVTNPPPAVPVEAIAPVEPHKSNPISTMVFSMDRTKYIKVVDGVIRLDRELLEKDIEEFKANPETFAKLVGASPQLQSDLENEGIELPKAA